MVDDLRSSDFSIYHTSMPYWGIFPFSIEIYRSLWSHMIVLTYEIHFETMVCLLSYHDLPGKPLLSHSVRPVLFSILMSSCFSFWDTLLWFVDPIQLRTWMTKITHLVMDDLVSSGFRPITHSMPYWGIFPFWLGFIDLHWFTWSSLITRYTPSWWLDFILS